jgi:gamma-glutamyl hydrolase
MRSYLLVLTLAAVMVAALPTQPKNPIIGIITHPAEQCSGAPAEGGPWDHCVESFYSRWLEDAGIRIVAIPFNHTAEQQQWWLERVNGVFFMGGGLTEEQLGPYIIMVKRILDYAESTAAAGNPFFVWGTCQGFQVIAAAAAGNASVIQGYYNGMFPAMLPVNFTGNQPRSRLWGVARAPSDVLTVMLEQNSTLNFHHFIVTPESFAQYPGLGEKYTMLATNIVPSDPSVTFVSSYESKTAEIYATQFHPERPPYEFADDGIGHNAADLSVSQYIANFIASRLKLNNNTFDTPQQAEDNSLARWPLIDNGWGTRTYFISHGDPVE